MASKGPIILLEDDDDDETLLSDIFQELNIPNRRIWFSNSKPAFNYLKTTPDQPFLILSDVNLLGESGIEFKRRVDNDPQLRAKSIPFVFYSTSVDQRAINEAYTKMTVQGFFKKGNNYGKMKNDIKLIFDYWQICKHPNS